MLSNSTTGIGDVGDSTGNPSHSTTDSNCNTKLNNAGTKNGNELNKVMAELNDSKLGNNKVTAKHRRLVKKWMKHLVKNLTSLCALEYYCCTYLAEPKPENQLKSCFYLSTTQHRIYLLLKESYHL